MSSALAASYFRASPATLPAVTLLRLSDWMGLGRMLYKGTWRSASLAVQFFDGKRGARIAVFLQSCQFLRCI
jgi:hypothetical protein